MLQRYMHTPQQRGFFMTEKEPATQPIKIKKGEGTTPYLVGFKEVVPRTTVVLVNGVPTEISIKIANRGDL